MRKHKACGASRPLKESYQTKLKQCMTRDLRREKVFFRSSTEHRFQAHVLATTVSSVTTDGNGTAPCLQSRSRDMHSVSTLKSREAGAQNWRLPWLHPVAALLRFTQENSGFPCNGPWRRLTPQHFMFSQILHFLAYSVVPYQTWWAKPTCPNHSTDRHWFIACV